MYINNKNRVKHHPPPVYYALQTYKPANDILVCCCCCCCCCPLACLRRLGSQQLQQLHPADAPRLPDLDEAGSRGAIAEALAAALGSRVFGCINI